MLPSKSILLADEAAAARLVLRLDLERDGRFAVVGEAATGPEAIELCGALKPDAVILDLTISNRDPDAIEDIARRSPRSKIIALSSEDSPAPAQAGAHALLDRRTSAKDISSALVSLCDLA
jgi:DNA-binding NarL/FixJ family response regulator